MKLTITQTVNPKKKKLKHEVGKKKQKVENKRRNLRQLKPKKGTSANRKGTNLRKLKVRRNLKIQVAKKHHRVISEHL